MNRHHSSWLLGCFGCYFFKSCRCWTWSGSDTHRVFSLLSLPFLTHFSSDPFQSLLMNWRVESGVLDEGDSAGLLRDSFENHFRDMFLNVTHITYYMHAQFWCSFNRLFGNIFVTLHARSLFRALIWNDKSYSARYEHRTVSALVCLAPDAEVKWKRMTRVWNVSSLMWS